MRPRNPQERTLAELLDPEPDVSPRDRRRFLEVATPIFKELERSHGVTHLYAHLPDRTNFVRVHRPELHGDLVERATLKAAATTGRIGAGKELGATAFALRVVQPWVLAMLRAAEDAGQRRLVSAIAARAGWRTVVADSSVA